MSWIDERLAEEKAKNDKESAIRSCSETVFNDMWSYVMGDVEEAKKKGKPLFTNGTPLDRVVGMSLPFAPSEPKAFHFRLSKDKRSIAISGEVNMTFVLDVCKDGSVCLTNEQGKQISYKEAARIILDPFLFPDLQPK